MSGQVEKDKAIQVNGDQQARPKLQNWQRIFVNRSLNMGKIKSIGFDLDHTLARYNREEFEALAFRATLNKFIEAGYPEELSRLKFDPNFLIRGLLVDMNRGNLLKVDGYKYVKIAFHGHTKLEKEVRHSLYNSESFKASEMLSMDTFFALSEVQLFTEIVDYMSRNPGKIDKPYREVYRDLRRFIDLSHADGTIKNEVMSNVEKYIHKDKYLQTTLRRLLDAGKSLFIATNSRYEYANTLMEYVLDLPDGDFETWRDYFDYVIVGTGKPGFFNGSQPFYQVIPDSGLLKMHQGPLEPDAIYQGGNARLFQKLTGFRGDEILYVGDHIYGDVIISKEALNWRTLLVLEELDSELPKLEELKDDLEEIKRLVSEKEAMEEDLQHLRSKQLINRRQAMKAQSRGENKKGHYLVKENEKLESRTKPLEKDVFELDQKIRKLINEREAAVHPVWGELMKVGLQRSRFADQVADYACLYTSRVSNMRFYSPFKKFASVHDILPHEL